jgi:uncharacterized repeat protein (TIGR01451 family)
MEKNRLMMKTKIWQSTALTISLLLAMAAPPISAQGWERTYPAGDDAFASLFRQALPTPDGGYLAAGKVYYDTILDIGRLRLVKTDGEGIAQWERIYAQAPLLNHRLGSLIPGSEGGYFALSILSASSSAVPDELWLLRLGEDGDTLWTRSYSLPEEIQFAPHAHLGATPDDGLIMLASLNDNALATAGAYLVKLDQQGEPLWERLHTWPSSFNPVALEKITPLPDGGFVACGSWKNSPSQPAVVRFDAQGEILWEKTLIFSSGDELWDVKPTADGGFLACGNMNGFAGTSPVAVKLDAEGNELWQRIYDLSFAKAVALTPASDGGFILVGSLQRHFWYPTAPNGFLLKIEEQAGEEIWQRALAISPDNTPSLASITPTADGGYIAAGTLNWQAFLIKTDALGRSLTNLIHGTVFHDADADCARGAEEAGLQGWKIKVEGEGLTRYASTDSAGRYAFSVGTGAYMVQVLPPSELWGACLETELADFDLPFDTLYIDFAAQAAVECPLMQVDVSVPFLRRCFDNIYTVHYCNEGTVTAEDAAVEIQLDPYLSLVSAELPFQDLDGNRYRFELGEVPINTCDFFRFTVYVDCEETVLGQTHCVEAFIFPDTLCPAAEGMLSIEASCAGDSARFLLRNLGPLDMEMPAEYIVIEDDVMYLQQPFQLPVGGTLLVAKPANGATYRLEVPQQAGLAGISPISATLEGCGTDDAGGFSTGFVNQFPLLTGSPFVAIECRQNIGAFDPNDKQALPRGFGTAHYIKPDTDLEYHIRFQNTGTDTAFTVVIRDTLPPQLDPGSVQPGAASHAYEWRLSGEGVLTFTFDHIMLPDSNVNEPASHGFVKFFVRQQLGNPLGEIIENRAGIYFDFNEPIITNTAFHTLGEDFLELINDVPEPGAPMGLNARLMPNPASERVVVWVEGLTTAAASTFILYSATGAMVRRQPFRGPQLELPLDGLSSGLYFFVVETSGERVASGKLAIGRR